MLRFLACVYSVNLYDAGAAFSYVLRMKFCIYSINLIIYLQKLSLIIIAQYMTIIYVIPRQVYYRSRPKLTMFSALYTDIYHWKFSQFSMYLFLLSAILSKRKALLFT